MNLRSTSRGHHPIMQAAIGRGFPCLLALNPKFQCQQVFVCDRKLGVSGSIASIASAALYYEERRRHATEVLQLLPRVFRVLPRIRRALLRQLFLRNGRSKLRRHVIQLVLRR